MDYKKGIMVFPKEEWEEAAPESQGMDPVKLKEALDYFKPFCGSEGLDQTVIVRNGTMVWKGCDIDNKHEIWSCTKSFTGTVLGLLIDDGKCTLDTYAAKYVPELVEKYSGVKLRHFASMTSGYNAVGKNYDEDGSSTPFVPDDPLFAPGEKYLYWDDAMNQFGNVLTRIAGRPMKDLFKERIADAIGMKDWDWGDWGIVDGYLVNGGAANGDRGVYTTAREFARFGLLFLNKGNWDGKQLISSNWVEQAASVQVPNTIPFIVYPSRPYLEGSGVYGFDWWVNGVNHKGEYKWKGAPPRTFAASGLNNNKCFVIPEWNMVIVRMGTSRHRVEDGLYGKFIEKMGEAITHK